MAVVAIVVRIKMTCQGKNRHKNATMIWPRAHPMEKSIGVAALVV